MGRHENFEDATPVTEQLQAETAIRSQMPDNQSLVRDWDAMVAQNPGFVPYPLDAPRYLLAVDGVIQAEAVRLLDLAEGEIARRRQAYLDDVGQREWPEVEQYLRAEMGMDALAVIAKRSSAASAASDKAAPVGISAGAAPDAELIALGGMLVDTLKREYVPFDAPNYSDDAWKAAWTANSAIVDQIEALPATTLAGLRVKAMAASWCRGGEPFDDDSDPGPVSDARLADGIVRDLLAMEETA